MHCEIRFFATEDRDEIVLNKATEIAFESSFKEPVSKGRITLPRNIKLFNGNGETMAKPEEAFRKLFKRGDKVSISWGYNGISIKEFEGYITTVSADIPVVMEFEDEMFKIKRMPVNFSSPNITLQELLQTIIPGYEIDALEGTTLGSVRLPKTQVGPVLEKLQSDWGLYTYWKDGKVRSGKYYAVERTRTNVSYVDGKVVEKKEFIIDPDIDVFHLERNCVSTALNYKRKEDVKLKIKAVSTLPNGSKIEVDGIGDVDGDERQLTFYNVTDVKELEALAKIEYKRFKVDGFDGSFTAFGTPSVTHGMKCKLVSGLFKEREGIYYIESVRKSFGADGIRQEIQLGPKAYAE
ncbi:hypothetical protein [Aequorivita ciconiae]|nr:hypothetical protein [Aequorivita sp. H23M31]